MITEWPMPQRSSLVENRKLTERDGSNDGSLAAAAATAPAQTREKKYVKITVLQTLYFLPCLLPLPYKRCSTRIRTRGDVFGVRALKSASHTRTQPKNRRESLRYAHSRRAKRNG